MITKTPVSNHEFSKHNKIEVLWKRSFLSRMIEARRMLRFLIIGCMALAVNAAFAAYKLTEIDACKLATAKILERQGGESKLIVNVTGCPKFIPHYDLGLAQIYVSYTTSHFSPYMNARYESNDLRDLCDFVRTPKGWKIDRCR